MHSLRHTNASLLIAQGVDVRTVASLLGHAQASTTLDIYAHAFDKNKRKAQEKLGKAIGLWWEKLSWPARTRVSYWNHLHLIITMKGRLGITRRNRGDWYWKLILSQPIKRLLFRRRNSPYENHHKSAEKWKTGKRAVHRCCGWYAVEIILKIKFEQKQKPHCKSTLQWGF